MAQVHDVVVIGAGWYGLAAAKTYLELHPTEDVVLLEAAATVGGVWAEHRLYPGLKTNNMHGTYEFPDFPMHEAVYHVKPGQHVPGPVMHRYLTDYAKRFGVFDRIRFNTQVSSAKQDTEGRWLLSTSSVQNGPSFTAEKLIVATGLTSRPHMPQLSGIEDFQGRIFHIRDFASNAETLETSENVVVLGGAKSAWDAAYAYVEAGVQVDMVIRKSGHGPVWMAPPYVTPLKKWLEKLVHIRFLTWLSPCIWGDEDGYNGVRGWLHGTAIGRAFVNTFWSILGGDVISLNKYDSHPELKKLKPWDPAFYIGSSFSIHNYPTSFFDLVKNGKIRVHIDEVASLGAKTVQLASGEALKADVLVCATGWKKEPALDFLDGEEASIGLHHSLGEVEQLSKKADEEILRRFPRLKEQPKRRAELEARLTERMNQPVRMYRFIVPPSVVTRRNIAFAGMISNFTTSICATVQALWICAFFDGKLDRLSSSQDDILWSTALHTQYGKWRYPTGYGPSFPDFVFDAVPYVDLLLRDLGINNHRKSGWVAEMTDPYGPDDYIGLVDEWRAGHEKS